MSTAEIAGRATAVSAERAGCSHCGLPVPRALFEAGAEHQFCCAGCRTVFDVIAAGGLTRYYDVRRELGDGASRPAQTTDRTYAEFDDEAFARLYCRDAGDGLRRTELFVEGVHCAACVWLVERAVRLVPGAVEIRLDVGTARARVVWDPRQVPLSRVARTLDSLGYPVHPFRGQDAEEQVRRQERAMLVRIGVAGACAGNAMAIGFAIYGGILHGMDPLYASLFRWTSLLVTIPALVFGGSVFFRGAWAALRTRTLHMDVPVALGIGIAFLGGTYNTVSGDGPVYFDGVTGLIFLLLAGRFVQVRQQRRAAGAAELLHALAPSSARRIEADGAVREVPVEALAPGARVEVRAGDTIPGDGVVRAGESALDTSLLTGEARPVTVRRGDRVHGGTTNLSARLEIEIETAGEDTRVGRLLRLVEEHARRRAPIVQLADRLSGWFVAAVLLLAAATGALWLALDPPRAVDNVVALLVVTCPCALGLATPLAVSAALGQAARAGLLIKGADVLERLTTPGRIWLDKTGTLTAGRLALVGRHGDKQALALAAALEEHSAHPVARAFRAGAAHGDRARAHLVEHARETLGGGIAGRVDGRRVAVGSVRYVSGTGAALPPAMAAQIDLLLADGATPVLVAVDGTVRAVAALADPLRPEAQSAVEALRAANWRVGILSGDHPRVVAAAGARLGLAPADVRGGVSPEDKLQVVLAERASGPVVMVGDGVNDAAALSAATVGIGVHGGAEASLAAADVFAARPGLAPVVALMEGARRTLAVVRRNLVLSLVYNTAGVGLAMAGLIDPLIAAVMMPASSLTVIISSYRAQMFREDPR